MTRFIPLDVSVWDRHLPSGRLFDENLSPVSAAPLRGAVSAVFGRQLTRSDILAFISEAREKGIRTEMLRPFTESGVTCAVFLHDRFDASFSHELKFRDSSADALHVKKLPDPRKPGVIVMDMDMTCVRCECIDEMAKLAGIGKEVSDVTSQAMNGKMPFQESFRRRIALFRGKSEKVMDTVEEGLPVMQGLGAFMSKAHTFGWKSAIASGGFTRFVGKVQRMFGIDRIEANTVEFKDGLFTGNVIGRIVDSSVKLATLNDMTEKYGIIPGNSIAVGDGANDLPMIKGAGCGLAIHAKPVVREEAPVAIRHLNMEAGAVVLEASLRASEALSA